MRYLCIYSDSYIRKRNKVFNNILLAGYFGITETDIDIRPHRSTRIIKFPDGYIDHKQN